MHIWRITNWQKILNNDGKRRTGIYFKYDQNVDMEVKNACKNFAKWLRSNYKLSFEFHKDIFMKYSMYETLFYA